MEEDDKSFYIGIILIFVGIGFLICINDIIEAFLDNSVCNYGVEFTSDPHVNAEFSGKGVLQTSTNKWEQFYYGGNIPPTNLTLNELSINADGVAPTKIKIDAQIYCRDIERVGVENIYNAIKKELYYW